MDNQFRTAYGPHLSVQVDCSVEPDMCKQSFKDECDINNLMARFIKTGVLDFQQKYEPRYGDCTGLEFQSAMQLCASAKSMFMELPAQVRARFANDPAQFLDFVQDEKNYDEALELGLVKAREAPAAPAGGGTPSPAASAPAGSVEPTKQV